MFSDGLAHVEKVVMTHASFHDVDLSCHQLHIVLGVAQGRVDAIYRYIVWMFKVTSSVVVALCVCQRHFRVGVNTFGALLQVQVPNKRLCNVELKLFFFGTTFGTDKHASHDLFLIPPTF
tara:strand:+ start:19021 stop:19380 length:360 start_codon:yes stop_codon:yes gene_type:complete